jgi:hypothetical protein
MLSSCQVGRTQPFELVAARAGAFFYRMIEACSSPLDGSSVGNFAIEFSLLQYCQSRCQRELYWVVLLLPLAVP